MMSAAAIFELVTLVAFFMLITGGKQKRERGWRLLSFLLVLVGILQCASMAVVVCISVYFHAWQKNLRLIVFRHISSITMTDSSLDGSCPKVGFFAQLAGASVCSRPGRSVHPHMSCLPKEAMKLYLVNVFRGDL